MSPPSARRRAGRRIRLPSTPRLKNPGGATDHLDVPPDVDHSVPEAHLAHVSSNGDGEHIAQERAFALTPRVASVLRSEGLLVFVVAVATSLPLVWDLYHGVTQDTWLAVLAGHEVATRGLPAHDLWTVVSLGHRWVDQQWFGQLVFSGLFGLGGLRLVMLGCAVAEAAALAAAVAFARRSGASARITAWTALLAFPSVPAVPRTQTLVLPLFVLLVILISRDSRAPSRRVLLTLPLLVLWANLHGSVILAAAMLSLYGLVAWRRHHPPVAALLIAAPWACVLASPYATVLPRYYRETLLSGDLGRFVVEWQPMRLMPITVPFFLLVALALYLSGRARGVLTRAEWLLLCVTGLAALVAVRNAAWFALAAACLLPPLLDRVVQHRPPVERMNRLLGIAGIVVLAGTIATVAVRPDAGLRPFPSRAAATAAHAAGRGGRVFATLTYADWLLWREPQLRGRIAFDARLELLDRSQLEELSDVSTGRVRLGLVRAYRVFVVDAGDSPAVAALRACGLERAYADRGVVVLTRARSNGLARRCGNATFG